MKHVLLTDFEQCISVHQNCLFCCQKLNGDTFVKFQLKFIYKKSSIHKSTQWSELSNDTGSSITTNSSHNKIIIENFICHNFFSLVHS